MEYLGFRFAFHAQDFGASVNFYHNILGMKYLGGWDRPDGKGALLSVGTGAVVEIYGPPAGERFEGPAPESINLALRLSDSDSVDQYYEALSSRGIRLESPPENHPWGHRSFVAYDPDGIPVHVYCELPAKQ